MCTTFLVNGTLSNGIVLGQFLPELFHMTALVGEGYHRTGMSIFLFFLRRLWIALAANSRFALKQCVASNRYARKICENFSKCLDGGIPLR